MFPCLGRNGGTDGGRRWSHPPGKLEANGRIMSAIRALAEVKML